MSATTTSNKHVCDWPEIFAGNEILTTAILDRLLHHVHIIHIDGHSSGRAMYVLVVWGLDRLSRTVAHLVNTVQDLLARGMGLRVLTGQGA